MASRIRRQYYHSIAGDFTLPALVMLAGIWLAGYVLGV